MKRYFILISMLILGVLNSYAQQTSAFTWATGTTTFQPSASTLRLNGVAFKDNRNGVIVGSDGKVYRTTNGGSSWIAITNPVASLPGGGWFGRPEFRDITYIGNNSYFAVASAGKVMKSTNGGESWDTITITPQPTTNNYMSVAYNNGIVFIGGEDGKLFKGTNNGQNWSQINDSDFGAITFNDICVVDNNTMYIAGSVGRVFKSTDGGESWSVIRPSESLTNQFLNIAFKDDNNGIVVGASGKVFKTNNGGNTWTQVENVFGATDIDGVIYKGNTIIVVGQGGQAWSSIDNGVTWQANNRIGYFARFSDLAFLNNNTAFAVGMSGGAFRLENITINNSPSNPEPPNPTPTPNTPIVENTTGAWTSLVANLPAGEANTSHYALAFSSPQVGVIVSAAGKVFRTTNGGDQWINVTNPIGQIADNPPDIYTVNCNEQGVYYAGGGNGNAMKSIYNGTMWESMTIANGLTQGVMRIATRNDVVLVSAGTTKYRSDDNGVTWGIIQDAALGSSSLYQIYFANDEIVYAVSTMGNIFKSNNAGLSWSSSRGNINTTTTFNSVAFKDAMNGIVVGRAGNAYITDNGGTSWTRIQNVFGNTVLNAVAYKGDYIVVMGAGGNAWISYDNGANWTQSNPSGAYSGDFKDVRFIDNNKAIAVGFSGGVYKLTITPAAPITPTIAATPNAVNFTANPAGSQQVTVTSNSAWTVSGNIEWLTVTPMAGNNNGTLTLTATANTGAQRSGIVTLQAGTATQTINVNQAASAVNPPPAPNLDELAWTTINSTNFIPAPPGAISEPSLRAIGWATAELGFAGGDGGRLYKTTDGGDTWNVVQYNTNEGNNPAIYDIYFANATEGYAALGGGHVMSTNDGGTTWTRRSSGVTTDDLYTVVKVGNAVFFGGYAGRVIKSTDNGITFENVTAPTGGMDVRSSYVITNTIFLCGQDGMVIKSTDGGLQWSSSRNGITDNFDDLMSIHFRDADEGYIVGQYGAHYKTTDGGANWSTFTLPESGTTNSYTLNGIDFNGQRGIIVGANGKAWTTENGGDTWTYGKPNVDQSNTLHAVAFSSENNAVAVGYDQSIYRYSQSTTLATTLTVNPTEVNFAAVATGTQQVTVTSNSAWTVSENIEWLTVTPMAGNNNGTLTLRATANTLAQARTGTVTVTAGTGANAVTQNITVTQAGTTTSVPTEYTWTAQTVQNIGTNSLYGLSRIDAMNAYAVGTNKTIIKTLDGGINWTPVENNLTQGTGIYAVHFISNDVGYIARTAAQIAKTTDYGATWSTGRVGTGTWRDVYFTNDTTGYACGTSAQVAKTINGTAWEVETVSSYGGTFMAQKVLNNGNIIAVGTSGGIYKKSNNDWGRLPAGLGTANITFRDVDFKDNNVGIVVGDGGFILRTTGGGDQWTRIQGASVPQSLGNKSLKAVCFADADTVYIGGDDGYMLKSTDAGATWSEVTSGTDKTINNIAFYSDGTGIAVCDGATVLRYGSVAVIPPAPTLTVDPAIMQFAATAVAPLTAQQQPVTITTNNNWNATVSQGAESWLSVLPGNGTSAVGAAAVIAQNNTGAARTGTVTINAGGLTQTITVNQAGVANPPVNDDTPYWAISNTGMVQAPAGQNYDPNLNAVWFVNATKGFAGGENGRLYKTTDGGATWALVTHPYSEGYDVQNQINDIKFKDANIGYIALNNGKALRTTDGGETWNTVTTGTNSSLNTVITKGDVVVIAGASGTIIRSANNGVGFTTLPSTAATGLGSATIFGGDAADNNIFYLSAGSRKILKSENAGETWAMANNGTGTSYEDFRSIKFIDANNGFVVGEKCKVFKTIDGATQWTEVQDIPEADNSSYQKMIRGIDIFGNRAVMVGTEGKAWTSINNGDAWAFEKPQASFNNAINDVHFVNATTAFAVGDRQKIYKLTFGGQAPAPVTPTLAVAQDSINFEQNATATITIAVTSNTDWTVSSSANWYTVTPKGSQNNGNIYITPTANGSLEPRINTFTVTAGDITKVITIRQNGIYLAPENTPNWEVKNEGVETGNINFNTVYFINEQIGFAGGTRSRMYKTVDGGQNWTLVQHPLYTEAGGPSIMDINFKDNLIGYASFSSGGILKTIDGGASWTQVQSGVTTNLNTIAISGDMVIIGTTLGKVVKSNDNGATFNLSATIPAASNRELIGSYVFDGTIYMSGAYGRVMKSNNGNDWTAIVNGITDAYSDLYKIHFTNNQNGYVIGQKDRLFKTENAGDQWTEVTGVANTNSGNYVSRLYGIDIEGNRGVLVGTNGRAWISPDNGTTWLFSKPENSFSGDIKDVQFINATTAFAVGADRKIYKVTFGTSTPAPTLAVDRNEVNFQAANATNPTAPQTETIGVTSNSAWTVTENIDWLTVNPESGTNNGTFVISVLPNTGAERAATVTVTAGTLTQTITVNQAAGTPATNLTVDPTSLSFVAATAPGSGEIVTITSNTNWTVTENLDWIDIFPTEGTGNGFMAVSATANTGAERTGNITVSGGGITRTITVTQAGTTPPSPTNPSIVWELKNNGTSDISTLYGVSFPTSSVGYAVGTSGRVYKTINRGDLWTEVVRPTTTSISGVYFSDADIGVVVSENRILRTTSGGTSWTPFTPQGTDLVFNGVNGHGQTIIAVGGNGLIMRTTDAGVTWNRVNSQAVAVNTLSRVTFASADTVFIAGARGQVFKSVDGGLNWSSANTGITSLGILRDIYFKDGSNGIVVGQSGTKFKTSNGGTSWQQISTTAGGDLLAAAGKGDVYIFTNNGGGSFVSFDNRETWGRYNFQSGFTQRINDLDFADANTVFAVGSSGKVYRGTISGLTPPAPAPTQGVWTAYDVTGGFNDVYALSPSTAVAGGGWNQNISRTTTSGDAWTTTASGSVMSIDFVDSQTGFAAGRNGNVKKTTDGGETWQNANTGITGSPFFWTIDFVNDQVGYVGGDGAIYKTINGGAQWTSIAAPANGRIYSLFFVNPEIGYAAMQNTGVYKTTNGGASWQPLPNSPQTTTRALHFFDEQTGYVTYNTFTERGIKKTTDGGETWVEMQIPQIPGQVTYIGIHFPTPQVGYACGWQGGIVKTRDGGATWTRDTLLVNGQIFNETLQGIHFADENNGYCVGDGKIFRYSAGAAPAPTPTLTVNPTAVNFNATATTAAPLTQTVTVTSNSAWTVSENIEWLTVTPMAGNNNGTLTLTATANTGVERTATVTVTAGTLTQTITVNQAAGTPAPTPTVLWTRITEGIERPATGTGKTLFALSAPTDQIAYIGGMDAKLYKTTDAGASWSEYNTAETNPFRTIPYGSGYAQIHNIYFKDAMNGYAVGHDGNFMRTDNGGATWTLSDPKPAIKTLWAVKARGNVILTSGYNAGTGNVGNMRRSPDGGVTWETITSEAIGTMGITDIHFVTDSLVYASGDEKVFKSYDGGKTWTNVSNGIDLTDLQQRVRKLQNIHFIDALNGYVVGNRSKAYKTTDGGATWTPVNQFRVGTGNRDLESISFYGNVGVIGGGSGAAWTTTDGGTTWNYQKPDNASTWPVNEVDFFNYNTAIGVGHDLRVYRANFNNIVAPPTLTVSSELVNFASAGTPQNITVTSNANWTTADDADWITVLPVNATTFSIVVTPNTGDSRIGTVVVTANNGSNISTRNITVTQTGTSSTPTLTVAPTAVEFAATATATAPLTQTITVTANNPWTVTIPAEATWLTATPANGTTLIPGFVLTAQPNTGSARNATVTVTAGGVERTITVTQAAPVFAVTPEQVAFAATPAGTQEVAVTSGSNWAVTNNSNWLTVDPMNGTNSGVLTLTAQPNTGGVRVATFTVTEGNTVKTITVTQAGSSTLIPGWTVVNAGPAQAYTEYKAIKFRDAMNGIAVGVGHSIARTNNGGLTWTTQLIPNMGNVYGLFNLRYVGDNIQLADNQSRIYKSEDNGVNWDIIGTLQQYWFNAVYFIDAEKIIGGSVADLNAMTPIRKTINGGISWSDPIQNAGHGNCQDFDFVTDQIGWAVGNSSTVLKTTDGGNSWIDQNPGLPVNLTQSYNPYNEGELGGIIDVDFVDEQTGYICGFDGKILKSTNGGAAWVEQNSGTQVALRGIFAINANLVYAVGDGGTILKTTNGGTTWIPEVSNTTKNLHEVYFLDANNGYAVGADRTIVKFYQPVVNPELTVAPEAHTFVALATANEPLTKTIEVTCNVDWTVTKNVEWLSVQPASGSNNGTFTITAQEHFVRNPRTGVVTVSAGGITKEITITQEAGEPLLVNGWNLITTDPNAQGGYGGWGAQFTHIAFKDNMHGFASGPNAKVAKTVDGGKNWTISDFPEANVLFYGLSYTNTSLRLAQNNNVIRKSTDDGDTWTPIGTPITDWSFLDEVVFVNDNTVIASTWGGTPGNGPQRVKRTTNGGLSWDTVHTNGFAEVLKFDFVNDRTGWGVGYKGTVVKTTDAGRTWTEQATPLPRNTTNDHISCLMGVDFVDANIGYAAGHGGKIIKTINGGQTWIELNSGTDKYLYDIKAYNADIVLAVGAEGTILRSLDGGNSWNLEPSQTTEDLQEVYFLDDKNAVAVGNKRTILRYKSEFTPTLNVTPTMVTLEKDKDSEKIINVTANQAWTVADDAAWLDLDVTNNANNNGTVKVIANSANNTVENRVATVTFTMNQVVKTVTVTQKPSASYVTINFESKEVPSAGETFDIELTSNDAWTITYDAEWVTVNPATGNNNAGITVTVAENPIAIARVATVTFTTANNATKTLKITQVAAGANLVLSTHKLEVDANSSSNAVTITSNVVWTASVDATYDWISVLPANGMGNGAINVVVNANTATTNREGVVTVSGGGMTKTIQVKQSRFIPEAKNWTIIPTTVDNDFTSVMMPSQNTAYITGWSIYEGTSNEPAKVLKTTNNGDTWTNYTPDPTMLGGFGFNTVYFTDNQTGHVAGFSSKYGKTEQGAADWNVREITPQSYQYWGNVFYSVDFINSNFGMMVGLNWNVYKTDNGGATWVLKDGDSARPALRCVDFVTDQVAYVVGDKKTIRKTTDGGNTWATQSFENTDTAPTLHGVHFINERVGHVVGFKGTYGKTTDGGQTWTWTNGLNGYNNLLLYSVKFVNATKGYIVGGEGKIFKTTDGGSTWLEEESGTNKTLMSIYFYDENNGFIVGKKSTILKYTPDVEIAVTPTEFNAPAAGKEQVINVTSSGEYTVTTDAEWIVPSANRGIGNGTITLTVTKNETIEPRVGVVKFQIGNIIRNVVVSQEPTVPTLTVSQSLVALGAVERRKQTITVTSNVNWTVEDINVSWIKVNPVKGGGKVTKFDIEADANMLEQSRATSIRVVAGNLSKNIYISQSGYSAESQILTITPAEVVMTDAAGSAELKVTSNQKWTVQEDDEWLSLNVNKGENNGTVKLTVTENKSSEDRTAIIVFKTNNLVESVKVIQKGKQIETIFEVTPAEITLAYTEGSEADITIKANKAWTASDDAEWLTLSADKGNNDGTIKVTANENTASEDRIATVTLKSGEITKTVKVTQKAYEVFVTINPESLEFTHEKGSKEVTIESNTKWTLTTTNEWITFTKSEGENNGNFNVEVSENNSTQERNGVITVSYGEGKTKTIKVKQAANPSSVAMANDATLVYPNPTEDVLFIKHAETIKSVKVIDARGKVVLTINQLNVNSVHMKDLTAGTYTIVIEDIHGNKLTKKISKL